MSDSKKLMLIDGHAVAYRAFYAIRSLSRSDGLPTNALYGFIRMLDQLRESWRPTHVCVVFDGGLSAERMAALPEYKQQREEMPRELRGQFDLIQRYLSVAGIQYVFIAGEEADDVLATQAEFAAVGGEVLIATSDKDMLQLVSDRISIVPPTKSDVRMGRYEVVAKTGVHPEQVAAWLALVGDTADNIPGLPGIGPKTAAKLLQEWHTLDGLYENLDQLPERVRNVLRDHRDIVDRNLSMTTLKRGMPVTLDWDQWLVQADTGQLLAFMKEMEFKSMAAALESPTLF